MLSYHWPGNVRQLEKAMIYAVSTAQTGTIEEKNFSQEIIDSLGLDEKTRKSGRAVDQDKNGASLSMQKVEEMTIRKALQFSGNNMAQAAALLGIGKSTLYKKVKEYSIR